jgi:lysophospholipase L1-like esterase
MRKVRILSVAQRFVLRLVLLVSSLAILALGMEIALRVAFYHSNDFAIEMWKYAVQLKHPVFNRDLRFVHAPNRHAFLMGVDVDINSHGLRDREYSILKAPTTYRILMLGDSTTFGWGVQVEATIPKLLERRLNDVRPPGIDRFEVLNAGVGNYNTVQELALYETIGRSFDPDLTVLIFFINDPEEVPRETNDSLLARSYLVTFLSSRFDTLLRRFEIRPSWQAYYASLYDDDKSGFRACQAALVRFATLVPKHRILVALLPELHEINGDRYPFRPQHKKITDVLMSNNVPVLDLIDGLKDRGPESSLWVTRDDVHPNRKANDLIAREIANWLWTHRESWHWSPGPSAD